MQQAAMSQGSSRLQQLPLEIQISIFSYLISPSGRSSILAVLLTCKSLYQVALPLSVCTFRNTPPRQGEGFCSERRNSQFLRYILIAKPKLAKFVDTIVLGSFSSDPNMGYDAELIDEDEQEQEDRQPFDEYRPEDLLIYKKRIIDTINPEFEPDFTKEWISDLEMGCSDAQIALILICCPNLRNLRFETPYSQRQFIRALQLADRSSSLLRPGLQPPLSRLQYIYVETQVDYSDGGHPDDRNPGPFFRLDSLRSFEGFNVGSSDKTIGWLAQLAAGSSNVEEIALRGSYISPQMLERILKACKAVKTLEISRGIYTAPVEELLPGHVMVAVLPHADSLEYLHLNMAEEFQLGIATQGEHLFLGLELRKMTALRTLVTGMRSLTGLFNGYTVIGDTNVPARIPRVEGAPSLVDCLPENLEYLEIHRCGESILEDAQSLISAVQEGRAFKRLKYLRLLFDREDVNPDKVQLGIESAVIKIDTVFQSLQNRLYDLIPAYRQQDVRVEAICSPIYAQNLREQWLAIRGQDIGCASTDFQVYEVPEV